MHDQNEEEELRQQTLQQLNVPHVKEVACFGQTSLCVADDNDIYIWGLDVTRSPHLMIDEPQLVTHVDENQMMSD